MEAGTALHSEALGDVLHLVQDLVAASRHDVLEHGCNRLEVFTDAEDRLVRWLGPLDSLPLLGVPGELEVRLREEHVESLLVVAAAERPLLGDVADPQHLVD